jgi:hypothetical protein
MRSRSRDAICIRVFVHEVKKMPLAHDPEKWCPVFGPRSCASDKARHSIHLPLKTREAERRTAHLGYLHLKEMQARSFATARLSALLHGYALRLFTPTRPGPRFLESPDTNGGPLSDASAAGTLQSDHVPDGSMPRPPAS